jgi:transporter family protein
VSWVAWSLVAAAGWGLWAVLSKVALRSLSWGHLVMAYWLALTAAVAVLVATRVDPRALASREGALAVGAGLASLVAVSAFFLALRAGPAAAVTPLSSLYPAVTAVLAVVVLRENPSCLQWTGVALAILAGVLLSRG